ncbi:MAG: exosortase [Pseudomonadales bacterium]|nr:exosortase [Pseudomonadales bacterium]
MAGIWTHSRDYVHGWLVPPICAWLVWRQRGVLQRAVKHPDMRGLLVMLAAVIVWIPTQTLHVNVVAQLAFVTLLVATVWAMVGVGAMRHLWFAAAFAFLAVPFSEGFVPGLMEWTATATVGLLRLSGFYVVREGMLFSTTAGDFAVAEACSGVRYLMAAVTAGALFAYLRLATVRYRSIFMALAIAVPIVGNALRAYLLVVIGQWFGMEHALGIDHFIHGAVFFGVLMLILFATGAWLARREQRGTLASVQQHPDQSRMVHAQRGTIARPALAALCLIVILAGPLAAGALSHADARTGTELVLPEQVGDWRLRELDASCAPFNFLPDVQMRCGRYDHPRLGRLRLGLAQARTLDRTTDLLGANDRVVDPNRWRLVATRERKTTDGVMLAESVNLAQTGGERMITWHTYLHGARATPSRVRLIGESLLAILGGHSERATLVVIAAENPASDETRALADFADSLPRLSRR